MNDHLHPEAAYVRLPTKGGDGHHDYYPIALRTPTRVVVLMTYTQDIPEEGFWLKFDGDDVSDHYGEALVSVPAGRIALVLTEEEWTTQVAVQAIDVEMVG